MSCSSRTPELARSAAFIISAAEGEQYLPALRRETERLSRQLPERLLAGAMIPSAGIFQAQRFRAHARQAFKTLFAQADVLIAPGDAAQRDAHRRSRPWRLTVMLLPIRASMGMLTQPISFPGPAGDHRSAAHRPGCADWPAADCRAV